MRILVIGGGGREHALVWKIAQSPSVDKIFCAPGNAGIALLAECVAISSDNLPALADFAERQRVDLTVVGPEAPLVAGIVDLFESRGLPIFGPSTDPARIEGSKAFAKRLMRASGIPTAQFWVCDTIAVAKARVQDYFAIHAPPSKIVVKADGLAAGKGVIIARNVEGADAAIESIMGERIFGASGDQVVIEEFLEGPEASIMVITDGDSIVPMLPSQDHKRAYNGDLGPNTGGMGAYVPVPGLPPAVAQLALDRIVSPAVGAIRDLGIPYRGALYAGIVVTSEGPKCIEFNCRFGDPEAQAVLPLLTSDIVPLLLGAVDCTLEEAEVRWSESAAVCVVAASGGYPDSYSLGQPIRGLDIAAGMPGCLVFHAGTCFTPGFDIPVTNGGRVLSVTGIGRAIPEAAVRAYAGMNKIQFDGIQYRTDIAASAL